METNPVEVEVELNAANIPGMQEKYSPSTLGAIFMPLEPTRYRGAVAHGQPALYL